MAFPVLGAIAGGVAALGSALGFKSQKDTNKANMQLAAQQNQYNIALAKQQNSYQQQLQSNEFAHNTQQSELAYQRQLEQWNMENEYNSPAQQLARYQAAGLNPNLIYGTGTASAGNTSTSSPSYSPAKYNAPTAQRATAERATLNAPPVKFDPYQAISIQQQLGIQKAQQDAIQAQADYTRQQTVNSALDEASKHFDVNFKRDTRELAMEQLQETLRKTHHETANLAVKNLLIQHQANLTEAQIDKVYKETRLLKQTHNIRDFELRLQKIGVTNRDGFITRLASRILLNSLSPQGTAKLLNY